ncbi:MAG: histidine kinase dimerization/phospho-acceptor domain-containing protein [Gemmatimonadaceae bacterium]
MKARNCRLRKRITDARLREVRAKRGKADLVAALGHELRTPMQAIFGYIELLEREIHGPLSLEQAHHLEQIRLNQQQLMELLNSVLDIASQDDGGRTPG